MAPSRKPRTCGEKCCTLLQQHGPGGSPPRMRGKGCCKHLMILVDGIIPAHAGKSSVRELLLIVSRDHPRMCREKGSFIILSEGMIESPPHVRGKVCHVTSCGDFPRITPACAGKSRKQQQAQTPRRDHPRVCGEKRLGIPCGVYGYGSPPRMRGKVPKSPPTKPSPRITPACAGKRRGCRCVH